MFRSWVLRWAACCVACCWPVAGLLQGWCTGSTADDSLISAHERFYTRGGPSHEGLEKAQRHGHSTAQVFALAIKGAQCRQDYLKGKANSAQATYLIIG